MRLYTLLAIIFALVPYFSYLSIQAAAATLVENRPYSLATVNLPEGFVYLDSLDKQGKIKTALRYGTKYNFVGRPIDGYAAGAQRIILTEAAAHALLKAQELFEKDGFSIVIYDAYRPQMAVDNFMHWSKDTSDQPMRVWFYPRVDKAKVFDLGYVAAKSGHSRGSTVDISLLPKGASLHPIIPSYRKLRDGYEFLYLDDGTVDMGTSFDLFDKASHTENGLITQEQQQRRRYLKGVMERCGFKNLPDEWWHFTLKDEPFPDTYFNFPVQ